MVLNVENFYTTMAVTTVSLIFSFFNFFPANLIIKGIRILLQTLYLV